MGYKKASFIENLAEKIGLIPDLHKEKYQEFNQDMRQFTDEEVAEMYENFPPPDKWDNWVEYDPKSWPKKKKTEYQIVPTTCFNCESACGLTAFIDKETNEELRVGITSATPRYVLSEDAAGWAGFDDSAP